MILWQRPPLSRRGDDLGARRRDNASSTLGPHNTDSAAADNPVLGLADIDTIVNC